MPPIFTEGHLFTAFSGSTLTSGASAYSDPIDLTNTSGFFGCWYTVASTGSPAVRIWFEESYDNTSANFAIPVGSLDIESALSGAASSGSNINSITLIPMKYLRFGATSLVSGDADARLTVKVYRQ
jgi:hypothetical protein